VNWIHLARDTGQLRALVNPVMNLAVPQKIWTERLAASQEGPSSMELGILSYSGYELLNFILSRSELHTKKLLGPPVRAATQAVLERKGGGGAVHQLLTATITAQTEQAGLEVTLYACIRKVSGSNLGQVNWRPWCFSLLSSVPPGKGVLTIRSGP
jgi:hypothetical protein